MQHLLLRPRLVRFHGLEGRLLTSKETEHGWELRGGLERISKLRVVTARKRCLNLAAGFVNTLKYRKTGFELAVSLVSFDIFRYIASYFIVHTPHTHTQTAQTWAVYSVSERREDERREEGGTSERERGEAGEMACLFFSVERGSVCCVRRRNIHSIPVCCNFEHRTFPFRSLSTSTIKLRQKCRPLSWFWVSYLIDWRFTWSRWLPSLSALQTLTLSASLGERRK